MNTLELKNIAAVHRAEPITGLEFNLQYSLRLIEASVDYLVMTNNKEVNAAADSPSVTKLEELISLSYLNCDPDKHACSKEMLKELLKDHERIIIELQRRTELNSESYRNLGADDFVTSLIGEHQNIAGIFRRFLISR